MTSKELAQEIAAVILSCSDRVTGIGAEQYAAKGKQKFEEMPLNELYDMAVEELDDIVAYAVMLRIRLLELKEKIHDAQENA